MAPFEPILRGRTAPVRGDVPSARLSAAESDTPSDGQPTLLDPIFDSDSCGVGFVASALGKRSHTIVEHALTALARLAHRGAVATDGLSSDGVGLLCGVPRELLLASTGVALDDAAELGVGMVFIPPAEARAEAALERCLEAHGLRVLCWRDVPVNVEVLGEIARKSMPQIRQVLVADATDAETLADAMERRLYLARKQFERMCDAAETTGYICSLSCRTLVYKGLSLGCHLGDFYPDLLRPEFICNFVIFHQRYATNTLPSWQRAQPARKLGHNGEINTVWGNRARMGAREATLPDECKPILSRGGTDSTSLDEAIEMLSFHGRTIAESVRMLLPPAVVERESAFLKYHGDCAEPWDGPAAISFSDGILVGAALDRNGLRPCRYAIQADGLVVAGSEAGLVDMDPELLIESGRLGPGEMIVVDMAERKVLHNDELLDRFDASWTYERLVDTEPLVAAPLPPPMPAAELLAAQIRFGYSKEDLKLILQPMAAGGKDAVWSMGDDTPLAFLAKAPRPLYAFFRQRFAQVTNPAIDPLREAVVVSLHTRLGPWPHLLDKHAPLPGISLDSPFLSLGQVKTLREGVGPHSEELRFDELACLFAPEQTLEGAINNLCRQAVEKVSSGVRLLLLTDRGAAPAALPVPMALATGAVHQALISAGLRTLCGIAVEAADCRDIHHAAVLIGFGAGAVCPWLALESARTLAPEGVDGDGQMLHALDAGLAKVMSKMGISVVDSYRGAGLFDTLGLHKSVVDRCFPRTPAPLSGVGFAELDRRLRLTWPEDITVAADPAAKPADLPDFGWVRFRKAEGAEPHRWQPPTVKALQTVVGSTREGVAAVDQPAAFALYRESLDVPVAATLRDLLEIRPAGRPLPTESAESVHAICQRFVASAMSLGSLSPEAHQTITAAMNMLGGRSNTGEGGEDPAVYRRMAAAAEEDAGLSTALRSSRNDEFQAVVAPAVHVSLNNKIKQIASGRFGVTAEYLAHADEIEIKVAQGAKPGEGGQLPGHKVSGLIARLRHAQPGVSLISPPPHHDIYSIEDLAQLIYDLKRVNPRASVGVKLVSSCGVGTVAAGVAKAYADFIVIAGNTGGTGAAALSSIKYAGNPWELGLAEAQQSLMANGMRDRVKLRTDGGIATARDVLVAALLGADEYAFGTAVLVSMGCDMARQCHLNTCPVGIATQRPELRAKFRGKPQHVVNFFTQLALEVQGLLAKLGLRSLEEATGRVDLLQQVRFDGELDLTPMLARTSAGPQRYMGVKNDRPGVDEKLDEAWTGPALAAARAGTPFYVSDFICNAHRSVGARLAGELGLERAAGTVGACDATFDLTGTAGQSFGAFAAEGMTLLLTGQANDFVGKGLSGGTLILRPVGRAVANSDEHVLLGNVALYGATSGRMFAAGQCGERFAVRNSGATAVVEGVGDHACEYMTGGMAVILGRVGINFGAGMTGGLAWVRDRDGRMLREERYHTEFLEPVPFASAAADVQAGLRALLEEHVRLSKSTLGAALLGDWAVASGDFVLFVPKPQA